MHQTEIDLYHGVLKGSVVFKDLPGAALNLIAQRGMMLEAKAGDLVLFEKTRTSPGLYLVLAGQVEVFLAHAGQPDQTNVGHHHLATMGPGHCFGEYSMIDGKTTSASARAISDAKLFFLPRGEFVRVVEHDHLAGKIIYRNFLLILISRLRYKDDELDLLIMQ